MSYDTECDDREGNHRQIVDTPVPQIHEDRVGATQLIPLERMTECVVRRIVDVPAPQFHEDAAEATAARSVGDARSDTGSVKKCFTIKGRFHHP